MHKYVINLTAAVFLLINPW